MSLNKIPLPGYGSSNPKPGLRWAGDYFGNNNYQQGGDKSYATDYGMVGIEEINFTFGGVSSSGTYTAKATAANNSTSINELYAPAYNNVTIKWYYTANSVEVANNTNLNNDSVRLAITGV